MKKMIALSTLGLMAINPTRIFAHPGHGGHDDGGYTIIHYFTQPSHLIVSMACIIATIAVVNFTKKKSASK